MSSLALAPARDVDLDRVVQAADAAARAAGVTVRELTTIPELDDAVVLLSGIWGRPTNPPVTLELLRAFTKAGNYVAGAYDHDGTRLVGCCVGFFHAPGHGALHSHIAGVTAKGRSVGFALKLHQRSWSLLHGVGEIAWTFDPLVARNAWFNLVKLGARPAEYLTDFYGPMADALNGTDETDRLLVRWPLGDPAVVRACDGESLSADARAELAAGAVVALDRDATGAPVRGRLDGPTALVAVPQDVEGLRVTDPDLARRWRFAVRDVLTALESRGGRVDGFDRAGWYVVRDQS